MNLSFSDLDVVVTGGAGALGNSVVELLLESGAVCHIPVRSAGSLEDVRWRDHDRVRISPGIDLTDEEAVVDFFKGVRGLWASIHCAGGFGMAPVVETRLADLEHQLRLNLASCFVCCREAAAVLCSRGKAGGRIVNVAARPALEPRLGGGMVAYTASKAAVAALTVGLAQELAERGIWVNAVAPSVMDTPSNRLAMPNADFSRWPTTDEVAGTILFLASPENRSTRGAIVPVYGRA